MSNQLRCVRSPVQFRGRPNLFGLMIIVSDVLVHASLHFELQKCSVLSFVFVRLRYACEIHRSNSPVMESG